MTSLSVHNLASFEHVRGDGAHKLRLARVAQVAK